MFIILLYLRLIQAINGLMVLYYKPTMFELEKNVRQKLEKHFILERLSKKNYRVIMILKKLNDGIILGNIKEKS